MDEGKQQLMNHNDYFNVNTSHQWYTDDLKDYDDASFEVHWAYNLFKVLTLIVIVFGVISNSLCIIVFAKREMRSVTIYLIFLLLAIVNTMSLVLFLLDYFTIYHWQTHLSSVICIVMFFGSDVLHDVDNLLIVLASFAYLSCNSTFLCCSNHQSNRLYVSRNVWYGQPCFLITMSLLVIVIIFSSINTSLFYCHGENGILNFGLLLFRPSVMIVAIITLSCIYVYRIIRHNCSTQTTPSHVMQAEAITNTDKQFTVTSHLFEIPLFLLQVSLLMSHAPLLLRDWLDSLSSD